MVFGAGTHHDLPLVLAIVGVKGSLITAGTDTRLFWEDPDLEEVSVIVV